MEPIDSAVASVRGLHLIALVSLFGTAVFLAVVLRAVQGPEASQTRLALQRVMRIAAASGLVTGVVWLVLQTVLLADANSVAMTFHAVPVVALRTQFGRWLLLRLGLLALVLLLPSRHRAALAAALVLAAIALAAQPLLGHAGAIGAGELIGSEDLHLLAAGAWLGGLLPLFIAITILPRETAALACRNFTPVGLAAILLLAGTAVVQTAMLMGGLPGLFGTPYGHVALIKLGAFSVLLALAALNRLVLTERLAGLARHGALHIRISITIESALGALVILTAGFLASQTPGTHEQPVWPFARRPSLAAFADPAQRGLVVGALMGLAVGVTLAVMGLLWRRWRWPGVGASMILLIWSIPHLGLLFIPAYPTSLFSSPTEFAATAIVHGQRLFAVDCMICHGAEGHGDGPAARSLPTQPADLTAQHFQVHADGDLYWFIMHGFTMSDGTTAMPGFGSVLSSEAIWDLIDYLHAHNAGEAMRRTGQWPTPVPVPQFDARCPDGKFVDLDDWRGRPLHIVMDDDQAELAQSELATIVVTRGNASRPARAACVAVEPQVWTAFAVLLGLSPQALDGAQVLVDPSGWLRAAWRPGDPQDWNDPRTLAAKVQDIVAHPLVAGMRVTHVHAR